MSQNILVVDDDEAVRKAFALALSEAGFAVETAPDGRQGLERFRNDRPALIFLDLKMPGMSGVEVLRQIRALDPSVPVYVVTAFFEEYFRELRHLGQEGLSFDLLQKPVDGEKLVHVAAGVLSGARGY